MGALLPRMFTKRKEQERILSVSHSQREQALHINLMSTYTNDTNSKPPAARPDGGSRGPAAARPGTRGGGETPLFEKLYRGMTSPLRLLPDFLIIGAQRGGTTSLYHYLQTHPCIEPSSTKEIHYFDRKFNRSLAWYRGHFPTRVEKYYAQRLGSRAFVTGEASPSYLFHPHVPARLARALPHARLIVLLRNPVDRAYSQYYHAIEHGFETLPFEAAIEGEVERTAAERDKILRDEHYESYAYRNRSYLSRGIYIEQLRAWMGLFPREQFLILKSEELYADPANSVAQVLAFLDLPLQAPAKQAYKPYNNTTYSRMDDALRKRLTRFFEPHNARLYDFLGVNFGWDE